MIPLDEIAAVLAHWLDAGLDIGALAAIILGTLLVFRDIAIAESPPGIELRITNGEIARPAIASMISFIAMFSRSVPDPIAVVMIIGPSLCYLGYTRKHPLPRAESKDIEQESMPIDERRAQLEEARDEAMHQHDAVLETMYRDETDWDMLFHLPAMQDVSVPETAALHTKAAETMKLRESLPEDPMNDPHLVTVTYPKAVRELNEAHSAALEAASTIGQSKITAADRSAIAQIKQHLALIEDRATSRNERNMAYARIRKLTERLTSITIPPARMRQLETSRQLMLEA